VTDVTASSQYLSAQPGPAARRVHIVAKCEQRRVADETIRRRRDDKTATRRASVTLSQAAVSANCNDRVLKRAKTFFWHSGFLETHFSGMRVGLCVLDSHSAPGWDPQLRETVGRLFVYILRDDVSGVWSHAEPPQYTFHTGSVRNLLSEAAGCLAAALLHLNQECLQTACRQPFTTTAN